MPTYDYQCRSCGTVTEVIHPMSEDGPSVCDQCGGALRRVLFPAGIIFKGSGFYRTDSRASSSNSNTSSGSSAGASSGGGSGPAATPPSTSSEGGGTATSTTETKGTASGSSSSGGSPSSD